MLQLRQSKQLQSSALRRHRWCILLIFIPFPGRMFFPHLSLNGILPGECSVESPLLQAMELNRDFLEIRPQPYEHLRPTRSDSRRSCTRRSRGSSEFQPSALPSPSCFSKTKRSLTTWKTHACIGFTMVLSMRAKLLILSHHRMSAFSQYSTCKSASIKPFQALHEW